MKYITRKDIREDNNDFKTSFHWELVVTKWPLAVYYPGDRMFKTRLVSVTPPAAPEIPINTENIHGFDILSYGQPSSSGILSGQFQDFVDQSIENLFLDWREKISDYEDKLGLPKTELVMDAELMQLDRELNPIKRWKMQTGLLSSFGGNETFNNEQTNLGKIDFSINFEHVIPELLNK